MHSIPPHPVCARAQALPRGTSLACSRTSPSPPPPLRASRKQELRRIQVGNMVRTKRKQVCGIIVDATDLCRLVLEYAARAKRLAPAYGFVLVACGTHTKNESICATPCVENVSLFVMPHACEQPTYTASWQSLPAGLSLCVCLPCAAAAQLLRAPRVCLGAWVRGPGTACPRQSRGCSPPLSRFPDWHLCGWTERIPCGTRQNDGLWGATAATCVGSAYYLRKLSSSLHGWRSPRAAPYPRSARPQLISQVRDLPTKKRTVICWPRTKQYELRVTR